MYGKCGRCEYGDRYANGWCVNYSSKPDDLGGDCEGDCPYFDTTVSVPEVMHPDYLPAFDGKPILASCDHCTHCEDVSDGPEYGPPWYICDKKQHMSNLKYFPFKTAQKCCDLAIAFTVDWDAIAKEEGYK